MMKPSYQILSYKTGASTKMIVTRIIADHDRAHVLMILLLTLLLLLFFFFGVVRRFREARIYLETSKFHALHLI